MVFHPPECEQVSHPLRMTRILRVVEVVVGLLRESLAAGTRIDPAAKGLGEDLRSRHVDIPGTLHR